MSSTVAEKRSTGSPCGIKTAADKGAKKLPRLVIGIGNSPLVTRVAAHFRIAGWEVAIAGTGGDARRLAVRSKAHVLVLAVTDTSLLTTAKLVTALPKRTKVVLVGPTESAELERASSYLGAATFVAEASGVDPLVQAVTRACCN